MKERMSGRLYYEEIVKNPEIDRVKMLIESIKKEYDYSPVGSKIVQLERNLDELNKRLTFLSKEPVFILPEEYKIVNPNCIDYITKVFPTFEFNIMLMGTVGSGKTYLSEIIMDNLKRYFPPAENSNMLVKNNFLLMESKNVYTKYLDALEIKSNSNERPVATRFNLLDDIGNERPGTEQAHNYIGGIIENLYDKWKSSDGAYVNILTTNLLGKKSKEDNSPLLNEYYGTRTLDRMREQYTVLKFNNTSFRKPSHRSVED